MTCTVDDSGTAALVSIICKCKVGQQKLTLAIEWSKTGCSVTTVKNVGCVAQAVRGHEGGPEGKPGLARHPGFICTNAGHASTDQVWLILTVTTKTVLIMLMMTMTQQTP